MSESSYFSAHSHSPFTSAHEHTHTTTDSQALLRARESKVKTCSPSSVRQRLSCGREREILLPKREREREGRGGGVAGEQQEEAAAEAETTLSDTSARTHRQHYSLPSHSQRNRQEQELGNCPCFPLVQTLTVTPFLRVSIIDCNISPFLSSHVFTGLKVSQRQQQETASQPYLSRSIIDKR